MEGSSGEAVSACLLPGAKPIARHGFLGCSYDAAMNLDGARVLVTGGAHRVGKAIVLGLARRGASVAFSYLHSADEAQVTLLDPFSQVEKLRTVRRHDDLGVVAGSLDQVEHQTEAPRMQAGFRLLDEEHGWGGALEYRQDQAQDTQGSFRDAGGIENQRPASRPLMEFQRKPGPLLDRVNLQRIGEYRRQELLDSFKILGSGLLDVSQYVGRVLALGMES